MRRMTLTHSATLPSMTPTPTLASNYWTPTKSKSPTCHSPPSSAKRSCKCTSGNRSWKGKDYWFAGGSKKDNASTNYSFPCWAAHSSANLRIWNLPILIIVFFLWSSRVITSIERCGKNSTSTKCIVYSSIRKEEATLKSSNSEQQQEIKVYRRRRSDDRGEPWSGKAMFRLQPLSPIFSTSRCTMCLQ